MAFSFLLERDSLEKVIIIGGGIAGLSCLNELLDQGHSPLLLEEKTIGLPKVCGEFLAPLALSQLQKWGIGPCEIVKEVCFLVEKKQFRVPFPHPAGAFSRREAELGLAKRAYEKGGRIQEHCGIKKIDPPVNQSPYTIHMDSGECIQTKAIIVATGKLHPRTLPITFPYQGFKIHVPHVLKPETLFMFQHPGAYFGMVPITAHVSNLTCLAQKKVVERWGSCREFFDHLITLNPLLHDVDFRSIEWLEGKAPDFKPQELPDWENAWWIGDALASFYPALGYGFAHGIHSALCAAHFYLRADAPGYQKFIKNDIKWKLRIGKLLHHSLMNKSWINFFLSMNQKTPILTQFFIEKAGYA